MTFAPRAGLSITGGLLLAASAPPWNLWPLAVVGLAIWSWVIDTSSKRQRFVNGFVAALVMFLCTLSWMWQFNVAGAVVLGVIEASLLGIATCAVPARSSWRILAFPSALFVAELVRIYWPLGGFPMGGFTLGQAEGPLLHAARIVGEPGLQFVLALVGVTIYEVGRRVRTGARPLLGCATITMIVAGAVMAVAVAGTLVPSHRTGTLNVAAVQGGGEQGIKLPDQNAGRVFTAHALESGVVTDPVDLILWPEDTVSVNQMIDGSPYDHTLRELARRHNAPVVAGVVEYQGDRFHNAVVVWNTAGTIADRYEKVHRVPFGEYVPGRGILKRFVDLSAAPRDVFPGKGNGVVNANGHAVGVAISYEGFFARQGRQVAQHGAELLIIPTNAASYKGAYVPNAQIDAARLRAVETGRSVVQIAPTGFSVMIDSTGAVQHRTVMGVPAVLQSNIALSTTRTPYVLWGNWPLGTISVLALVGSTWAGRFGRRAQARGLADGARTKFC